MEFSSVICKANDLTMASFKITLNEQRLILACIAQIKDPRKPVTNDDKFTVSAPYFSRLFNLSPKNAYKELFDAARLLNKREVLIDRPNPESPGSKQTLTGWIDYVDVHDSKVVITFRKLMLPYISSLTNGCFTQYRIEQVAKIKSVYAIRLYEILVSKAWQKKDIEIQVALLKNIFELGPDEYARIFDFKKYIIDPSVKSINENTDCSVKYVIKKTGRTVSHLVFKYKITGLNDTNKPPKIKPLPKPASLTPKQGKKVLTELAELQKLRDEKLKPSNSTELKKVAK